MIMYLELAITDGVSVSIVSPLVLAIGFHAVRLRKVAFCVAIIRCTDNFDHPVSCPYLHSVCYMTIASVLMMRNFYTMLFTC
jgi:hypothetical protein